MKKETRTLEFEIRAEQSEERGHYLTGQPIVFGSRTDLGPWDEIIEAGALDSTDLRDVRFLVNHNTDMIPLARSRNNNERSTMQLSVVEDGMQIRVDLDTENNSDARNLYSAVTRGDVSGMSFMFTTDEDSWEELESEHPTRHIRSISKVFEVSAVTFPAYAETNIQARAIPEPLESGRESLDSAKAQAQERADRIRKIKLMLEV